MSVNAERPGVLTAVNESNARLPMRFGRSSDTTADHARRWRVGMVAFAPGRILPARKLLTFSLYFHTIHELEVELATEHGREGLAVITFPSPKSPGGV